MEAKRIVWIFVQSVSGIKGSTLSRRCRYYISRMNSKFRGIDVLWIIAEANGALTRIPETRNERVINICSCAMLLELLAYQRRRIINTTSDYVSKTHPNWLNPFPWLTPYRNWILFKHLTLYTRFAHRKLDTFENMWIMSSSSVSISQLNFELSTWNCKVWFHLIINLNF